MKIEGEMCISAKGSVRRGVGSLGIGGVHRDTMCGQGENSVECVRRKGL